MNFLIDRLDWPFPLETMHDGIPLGNGLLGALLWGNPNRLLATVNRSDYWDHRAGKVLTEKSTYENVYRLLQAGDLNGVQDLFKHNYLETEPSAPTRLAMGRFELVLEPGSEILGGGLRMHTGEAELDTPRGTVRAIVLRSRPVLAFKLPEGHPFTVLPHPADADDIKTFNQKCGYPEAKIVREQNFCAWTQIRPNREPVMCAACRISGSEIFITSVYGDTEDQALSAAKKLLAECVTFGFATLAEEHRRWWLDYWAATPKVCIPDDDLSLLYHLGMYKFAGMAAPGTPPAGLQGPWVEDYCLPPWQCDYHWNINVQECYWPAYGGNHPEWLRDLFEMLWGWVPLLRNNARQFLGIDDGIMLLHATDDRGQREYGSWLAVVDFGCAAWIAHMMWQYYRYTLDETFLRDRAYPFMKGAMRVYEKLLVDDGTRYHLPMGVNPEIYDDKEHYWGRNASFQLANLHAVCEALIAASEILNIDARDRTKWIDIHNRTPLASIADTGLGEEIQVWDDLPLPHSHRHHSHLGGIFPFGIFDFAPGRPHEKLVKNSMFRLMKMGMDAWTGWCVPWAAILHARTGNGVMAKTLLDVTRRFFLRPGYASLHDAMYDGFTYFTGRKQIMQLDAQMGATTAVMELLLHTRRGVLYVFPAVPPHWPDAAFQNIRAEGAFLVSAIWTKGRTVRVEIDGLAGQTLKIANPFGKATVQLVRTGKPVEKIAGDILEIPTAINEKITLLP